MMKYIILLLFTSLSYGQGLPNLHAQRLAIAGCTADPNEQNTTAGITSDPNCNESNSISGWLSSGSVTESLESSDVNEGSYALKIVSDAGSTEFTYRVIGGSGDEFDVSFDIKQTVGSNARFYIVGASPNGSYYPTSSWTTHTFSTTGSAAMIWRFYPAGNTGAGDTGDTILLDNLSVVKTN